MVKEDGNLKARDSDSVRRERANRENRQCQRCVPSGCTRVHIEKSHCFREQILV